MITLTEFLSASCQIEIIIHGLPLMTGKFMPIPLSEGKVTARP